MSTATLVFALTCVNLAFIIAVSVAAAHIAALFRDWPAAMPWIVAALALLAADALLIGQL